MRYWRQLWESFSFAISALQENLLRTLLSLLGVTVGVFSIIGMLTFVDSLEKGVKGSLNFLGEDVIYVEKWPWEFSDNYPWWKYVKRPQTTYEEYRFLKKNLKEASAISIFAVRGNNVAKYKNNSLGGTAILGISQNHHQVSDMPLAKGRYFTGSETETGASVVIIGSNVAKELFAREEPIGKDLKLKGQKFRVVAVLEAQGDNLLGAPSNDGAVYIPFRRMTQLFYSGKRRGVSPTIAVKGYATDQGLVELENEIRGLMRIKRGLRPLEDDSFALNRPEVFAAFVESLSRVLGLAGSVIGLFALLVGGFGIANIMFVSVKERTHIIGIKKSMGAQRVFILMEFLFEAILLSLIGGIVGLLLVGLVSLIPLGSFELVFSAANMLIGTVIAVLIGILSGLIPAVFAARLNPVDAIRSK
ncbi:MAG: ABC transporter permease [Bernardetiaceae bacterium]